MLYVYITYIKCINKAYIIVKFTYWTQCVSVQCTLYNLYTENYPLIWFFYSSVAFFIFSNKTKRKILFARITSENNLSLGLFLDTFITCFPFSIISRTYDINVLKIIMTIDAVCVRKKHICKQNIAIQTWLVCFVCANYETKLRHKNRWRGRQRGWCKVYAAHLMFNIITLCDTAGNKNKK